MDDSLPCNQATTLQRLRAVHTDLCHRVQKLTAIFTEGHAPEAVKKEVEALRMEMARRFAEEEADGCLEEAALKYPNLSGDTRTIASQHRALLTQADEFLTLAANVPAHELSEEFLELAQAIEAHQRLEERILEHVAVATKNA